MSPIASLRLVGAALLIAASVPATAADSASTGSGEQAAANATGPAPTGKSEKAAKPAAGKICKMLEATGTRVARKSQKVCMTARQWRDYQF